MLTSIDIIQSVSDMRGLECRRARLSEGVVYGADGDGGKHIASLIRIWRCQTPAISP